MKNNVRIIYYLLQLFHEYTKLSSYSIRPLLIKKRLEYIPEALGIMDYATKRLQAGGVSGFGNINLKLTAVVIFLGQMVKQPLPMAFLVQLGIVIHTILDRAAQDPHRVDVPVSLGDYLAVDAPWLTAV